MSGYSVSQACEEDLDFRRGLPVNFGAYMGGAHRHLATQHPQVLANGDGKVHAPAEFPPAFPDRVAPGDLDRAGLQRLFVRSFWRLFEKLRGYVDPHGAADLFLEDFMGGAR